MPLRDRVPTLNPITVMGATTDTMTSTHEGNLPYPALQVLPPEASRAHQFPGIGDLSLLSVGLLADHGCVATFDKTTMTIKFKGTTLLTATRSEDHNKLYILDQPKCLTEHLHNQSIFQTRGPRSILSCCIWIPSNLHSQSSNEQRIPP